MSRHLSRKRAQELCWAPDGAERFWEKKEHRKFLQGYPLGGPVLGFAGPGGAVVGRLTANLAST